MKILLLAAALLVSGPPYIDGDTVVVNGTHIRLKGVDAPELSSELNCRLTGE